MKSQKKQWAIIWGGVLVLALVMFLRTGNKEQAPAPEPPPARATRTAAGVARAIEIYGNRVTDADKGAVVSSVAPCRGLETEAMACLQVQPAWHFQPQQLRKDAAAGLWKLWATICVGNKLAEKADHCRIKLLSASGDEVGGSRALAGSLIWVKD